MSKFISNDSNQSVSKQTKSISKTVWNACKCFYSLVSSECMCPCDRVRPVQNLTDAEIQAKIDQIKQELVLNTRTLSSSIRKRTSAKDERPSATGVGVILGVGIVTFLLLAVIVPDIPMMIFSLRNNYVIQILIEKYRHRKWCTIDFDLRLWLWYVLYLLDANKNKDIFQILHWLKMCTFI